MTRRRRDCASPKTNAAISMIQWAFGSLRKYINSSTVEEIRLTTGHFYYYSWEIICVCETVRSGFSPFFIGIVLWEKNNACKWGQSEVVESKHNFSGGDENDAPNVMNLAF